MNAFDKTNCSRRRSRLVRSTIVATVVTAAVTVAAMIPAGASSNSVSAGVARARAAVIAAEKIPTHILQTTRLNSRPKHHLFIFIYDDIQQSQVIADGAIAGLQAAGWQTRELEWLTGNPSTLVTELQAALQYHPFAVAFAGATSAVWGSEVAAYKAAHVWLVPSVIGPQATYSSVGANVSHFLASGAALGDWLINDSNGHGKALVVDANVYPILTEVYTGVKKALAANGPSVSLHYMPISLADWVANLTNGQIVTFLRENSSYKYVISTDLTFTSGLRSAINTAGLTGIKIIGAQPNPPDFSSLQSGDEQAFVANNNTVGGWAVADAVLRLSEGMSTTESDLGQPFQLITAANASIGFNLAAKPAGFISGYMHLWRLG